MGAEISSDYCVKFISVLVSQNMLNIYLCQWKSISPKCSVSCVTVTYKALLNSDCLYLGVIRGSSQQLRQLQVVTASDKRVSDDPSQSWFYQIKMGKDGSENIFQSTHCFKRLHMFIQNPCFHCPHTFMYIMDTEREHEVLSQNNNVFLRHLLTIQNTWQWRIRLTLYEL